MNASTWCCTFILFRRKYLSSRKDIVIRNERADISYSGGSSFGLFIREFKFQLVIRLGRRNNSYYESRARLTRKYIFLKREIYKEEIRMHIFKIQRITRIEVCKGGDTIGLKRTVPFKPNDVRRKIILTSSLTLCFRFANHSYEQRAHILFGFRLVENYTRSHSRAKHYQYWKICAKRAMNIISEMILYLKKLKSIKLFYQYL